MLYRNEVHVNHIRGRRFFRITRKDEHDLILCKQCLPMWVTTICDSVVQGT